MRLEIKAGTEFIAYSDDDNYFYRNAIVAEVLERFTIPESQFEYHVVIDTLGFMHVLYSSQYGVYQSTR